MVLKADTIENGSQEYLRKEGKKGPPWEKLLVDSSTDGQELLVYLFKNPEPKRSASGSKPGEPESDAFNTANHGPKRENPVSKQNTPTEIETRKTPLILLVSGQDFNYKSILDRVAVLQQTGADVAFFPARPQFFISPTSKAPVEAVYYNDLLDCWVLLSKQRENGKEKIEQKPKSNWNSKFRLGNEANNPTYDGSLLKFPVIHPERVVIVIALSYGSWVVSEALGILAAGYPDGYHSSSPSLSPSPSDSTNNDNNNNENQHTPPKDLDLFASGVIFDSPPADIDTFHKLGKNLFGILYTLLIEKHATTSRNLLVAAQRWDKAMVERGRVTPVLVIRSEHVSFSSFDNSS